MSKLCVKLRKRWLAAEKRAHKTLEQKKMRAHRRHEHESETIYEQAATQKCKWVN